MVIPTEDWLHSSDTKAIYVVYLLSPTMVVVRRRRRRVVVVVQGWRTSGRYYAGVYFPSCKNEGETRVGAARA